MKRSMLFLAMVPLLGLTLAGGCSSSEICDTLPGTVAPADAGIADASCSATVVVGLYGDDQCKPGAEVLKITFHTKCTNITQHLFISIIQASTIQ